jgi:23S rRNA U2552 (ribose-2'-O)-methylase RlmE/FtsJ
MRILNWELFLEELVGENEISNYQTYADGMAKSMDDKLFFVNNIDFDVIVDFGCANGIFLSKLQTMKPNVKIIGYDLDDVMLSKARVVLGEDALLTSSWDEVVNELSNYENPLLNLSSVIHEVYSYSHSSVIKKFWEKQVFGGNFKWITIRDMIPSSDIHKNEIENFRQDVKRVRKRANNSFLNDFEKRWGSIDDNYRTFCHFLLKYRYIDNWEREVSENYLPVSLETVKTKIPSSYSIEYEQDFIVPFIKDKVGKDFGVKITHSTHVKMILRNNNFK